jgi:hypothetical protein
LKVKLAEKLVEHKHYIRAYGQDIPEIHNWRWNTSKRRKASMPKNQLLELEAHRDQLE